MKFWTMLGIGQTKDIDAITKAYHEKLQLTHPEEKPQEFMQLRAEYDEAMKYARTPDENDVQTEKSPIDIWMDKAKAIYNDYPRRISVSEWEKLLADDVCQELDSAADARDALLAFMMENYYLPQYIYELLEKHFHFQANREELYEKFPKNFIDNAVIGSLDGQFDLPYELCEEGTSGNPDAFFRLFFKARDELDENDRENAVSTIADIENLGVLHPFIDYLNAHLMLLDGNAEGAVELINPLAEKFSESIFIRHFRGTSLLKAKHYEEAAKDFEYVISILPEHNAALYSLSECYMKTGKLEEARKLTYKLIDLLPYHNAVKERMREINERAIKIYAENHAENPDDFECAMKYAWCLIQMNEPQKAKELTDPISAEGIAQICDLENFRTKLSINLHDYESAIVHAKIWEENTRALPDGETEEQKKRKGKLGESILLRANALCNLRRYDEALPTALEAKTFYDNDPQPYETCRVIYAATYQWNKAVEEAEKVAEIRPDPVSFYILGTMQYHADRKSEAFRSFGRALEYSRDEVIYIQRAKILCDYEEWDDVEEIINMLADNNIDDDCTRYLQARILHERDKNDDEALKIYNGIIENFEAGKFDNGTMWEVYFDVAFILSDVKGPAEVLEIIDKGLAQKADYYPLLNLKAWALDRTEKYDEAIEQYKRILEFFPHNYKANMNIGNIYFDDFCDYETALKYYERQLEIDANNRAHTVTGMCLMYLGREDEAEKHFLTALEIAPDSVFSLNSLGKLYERRFEFERSLPLYEECVKINEKNGNKNEETLRNLARVLARLGRFDDAVKAFEKNLELFSDNFDAQQIVYLRMQEGAFDLAEEAANKFRKQGIFDDRMYYNRIADIYRLRGDLGAFLKYTEKIPDDADRIHGLAEYYAYILDYKKAVEYYSQLHKLDPDREHTFNDWLICLNRLGDKEELKKIYKYALGTAEELKGKPWMLPLYYTKTAYYHIGGGHPEKAKPFIDMAFKSPLCSYCKHHICKDAYTALAEYYEAVGEYDKAIETCIECLKHAPGEDDAMMIMYRIRTEHKNELKKENR